MSLLLETIEKHTNFTRKSEKFNIIVSNIIFGDTYEYAVLFDNNSGDTITIA